MKPRGLFAVGLVVATFGYLVLSRDELPADPRAVAPPPAVVLIEGVPQETTSRVMLRIPTTGAAAVHLGTVTHAPGSALRGVLWPQGTTNPARPHALVIAAERESRDGSTYHSALFRVDGRGESATRLVGSLTDASRPLVTPRGTVLVQSGADGEDPPPDPQGRVFRERVDTLTLLAVNAQTASSRTVWTGRGMIAFLATALRDDEALVYHVDDSGARLFALDATTGATRAVVEGMLPLARDFSYDVTHDEVVFARAVRYGSEDYEVVSAPAHGPATRASALRVRWRAKSDRTMPRALGNGTVALSLPESFGLALLAAGANTPHPEAPLGAGDDCALDETRDGRWIALRHTTHDREVIALYAPGEGRVVTLDRPELYTEVVGLVATGVAP